MTARTRTLPHLLAALLLAAAPAWSAGLPVELVAPEAPLVDAAKRNDAAASRALLKKRPRPDVNQRAADGTTALHWAVHHDDVELAEALLEHGADARARNDYGATPMSEVAVTGNVRLMRRLLAAGADAESPNADGQTALMLIARTSNIEAAKLLLARGAKVNAREAWREQTPLMWAAAQAQPAMVQLLIEHGAEIDARSRLNEWERQVTAEPRMQARPSGGFTPLLYAARKGCLQCVQHLVKGGADVNLPDPDRISPLLMAAQNFNFDIAAFLLEKGADPNKWDLWGRAPLYAAVDLNTLPVGGRADRPSMDDTTSLELIERLLQAGANPNLQLKLFPPYRSLRDDRGADGMLTVGTTALLRAAKAGDAAAVKLLLAHGANPNLPTVTGITPLMAAAGNSSSRIDTRGRYKTEAQAVETVKLLLAAGAEVNARDNGGQTALHGAATWGWNDLVRTLAASDVDLAAKDARGRTALDIAMGATSGGSGSGRSGSGDPHPETVALLRELLKAAPPTAGSSAGATGAGLAAAAPGER